MTRGLFSLMPSATQKSSIKIFIKRFTFCSPAARQCRPRANIRRKSGHANRLPTCRSSSLEQGSRCLPILFIMQISSLTKKYVHSNVRKKKGHVKKFQSAALPHSPPHAPPRQFQASKRSLLILRSTREATDSKDFFFLSVRYVQRAAEHFVFELKGRLSSIRSDFKI